ILLGPVVVDLGRMHRQVASGGAAFKGKGGFAHDAGPVCSMLRFGSGRLPVERIGRSADRLWRAGDNRAYFFELNPPPKGGRSWLKPASSSPPVAAPISCSPAFALWTPSASTPTGSRFWSASTARTPCPSPPCAAARPATAC